MVLVSICRQPFSHICSRTTLHGARQRKCVSTLTDTILPYSNIRLPQEVEESNFFVEVPRILKRFWVAFLLCFAAIAGMVIFSTSIVPVGWQIPGYSWAVILPLASVGRLIQLHIKILIFLRSQQHCGWLSHSFPCMCSYRQEWPTEADNQIFSDRSQPLAHDILILS